MTLSPFQRQGSAGFLLSFSVTKKTKQKQNKTKQPLQTKPNQNKTKKPKNKTKKQTKQKTKQQKPHPKNQNRNKTTTTKNKTKPTRFEKWKSSFRNSKIPTTFNVPMSSIPHSLFRAQSSFLCTSPCFYFHFHFTRS